MPTRPNRQLAHDTSISGTGIIIGMQGIADAFGVSLSTIKRWMDKHGLRAYATKLPSKVTVTTIFRLDDWVADRGRLPIARARVALDALSPRERLELMAEYVQAGSAPTFRSTNPTLPE